MTLGILFFEKGVKQQLASILHQWDWGEGMPRIPSNFQEKGIGLLQACTGAEEIAQLISASEFDKVEQLSTVSIEDELPRISIEDAKRATAQRQDHQFFAHASKELTRREHATIEPVFKLSRIGFDNKASNHANHTLVAS